MLVGTMQQVLVSKVLVSPPSLAAKKCALRIAMFCAKLLQIQACVVQAGMWAGMMLDTPLAPT